VKSLPDELLDLDVFLAFDYSQLEIRILAEMSRDPLLISQFRQGLDIHCAVGNALTGWSFERIKAEKNLRKMVKNMHFGIVFGINEDNVYDYVVAKIREIDGENADLTGITPETCKKCFRMYFVRYKGVARFIETMRAKAERDGYVETIFGFRRSIYQEDETRDTYWGNQAINCVDFETEILTQRGWLRGDQLKQSDLCLTETGWQHPSKINLYPLYDGPVHVWKSRSFSAVSTPEHRWKVFNPDKQEDQIWTSKALPKFSHWGYRVYRTIPEIPVKEVYTDDFVSLCGWVLTDGYFPKSNRSAAGICQKKPEMVKEIQQLMNRLGITTGNGTKQKTWHIGKPLGKAIRKLFPRRALTHEFISKLSRRQARLLISTMLNGDGSEDRSLCCGDSRRKDLATGLEKAEAFQMLCAWAGYASALHQHEPVLPVVIQSTGQLVAPSKPYYTVAILKRDKAQIWKEYETVRQGNGVWCPTFANDAAWVARREGSTFITKNSPIQGSAHTLVLIAMALLHQKPLTYSLLRPRPLMEVHDALFFLVKLRDLPQAFAQGRQLLETEVVEYTKKYFGKTLQVPLIAEAEAGFCMGSCVEFTGQPLPEFLDAWRAKHKKVEAESWKTLLPKAV
jgi:hypothetical protein